MAKIEELLQRRTDLSTFLVHLTKDTVTATAREALLSILDAGFIEARTAFGPARHLQQHLESTWASQKAVCFTETPLEHVWMMLQDIEGRQVHFKPYGLATTKTAARVAGANPVWYSDMTPGNTWPLSHMTRLVDGCLARATQGGNVDAALLQSESFLRLTPYFETMGPTSTPGVRKEFWWEREWRKISDYPLQHPRRWVAVLAPEDDHELLRGEFGEREIDAAWGRRPILDPTWGLERMLAALADVDPDYLGPFTG